MRALAIVLGLWHSDASARNFVLPDCHNSGTGDLPLVVTMPSTEIVADEDWAEVHGSLHVSAPLTYVDFPVQFKDVLLVPAANEACLLAGIDISTEVGIHQGFVEAGLDGSFELIPQIKYTDEKNWDTLASAATAECDERTRRTHAAVESLAGAISSVYEQSRVRFHAAARLANDTTFARAAVEVATAARKRAKFVSSVAWNAATGDVDCPVGSWRVPLLRTGDTCTDAATGVVYVTHQSTVYELPAVLPGEAPTGVQIRVAFVAENIDSVPPMFARLPFRLRARCLHSSVTVQEAVSALNVDRADSDSQDLLEKVSPAVQTSKGLLRGLRRRLQLSPSMSRMLAASVQPQNVQRTLVSAGDSDNVVQCAVDSALDCGINAAWFFVTSAVFAVAAAWREYRVLQYRATATTSAQKLMTAFSQIVGMLVDVAMFALFLTDVSMRFTCIRDASDADCAAVVAIQVYTAMALLILAGVLTLRIVLACGAVRGLRGNLASRPDVDGDCCTLWIVQLFLSCCSSRASKVQQVLPPCCQHTCSRLFANVLTLGGYDALDYRRVFAKPTATDVAFSAVCALAFAVVLLLTQTVRRIVLGIFVSTYAIAPLLALGAHSFFGEQGFEQLSKTPV